MVRVFSLMTCVMLVNCVMFVQAADNTTVSNSTLKSMVKSMLDDALAKRRSSSGRGLRAVAAELVAEQTRMQNLIDVDNADLQKMKLDLQKTQKELEAAKKPNSNHGSTFVRWGRKICPANTKLVYRGVAGGKHFLSKGSGTNTLCLTRFPQFDNTSKPERYGKLFGAEYQYIRNLHNREVPCSVCRAPQSVTIMMAATQSCPSGWTAQYMGFLAAEFNLATEYVCLDRIPVASGTRGFKDDPGYNFCYVAPKCGSLPCPPYQKRTAVTCVVCSSAGVRTWTQATGVDTISSIYLNSDRVYSVRYLLQYHPQPKRFSPPSLSLPPPPLYPRG